jgi:hypothetical protein
MCINQETLIYISVYNNCVVDLFDMDSDKILWY